MIVPTLPRQPPPEAWQLQTHVDIGALAQRVTGLETGVQEIRGAIGELSKKLDAKPTNWYGIIAAQVGLLTVIGGAITFLVSPINASLERHERDIARISENAIHRSDYLRDAEQNERWLGSLRDRVRYNEDRGVFADDLGRVEKELSKLADMAATKTDLADDSHRTDERISALSAAINEIRHDVYVGRAQGVSAPK